MGDIFLELEKVKIHRIQQNGTAVSQITLDDDYNVPDSRPDIMKVLKENGELRFDEVKAAIAPEAQQVITDNLGSFDKYLTAVIEDAVLHIKNEDPYLTLSGELLDGVTIGGAEDGVSQR